jgi:DNA-binding Xre family transcriptional regulator
MAVNYNKLWKKLIDRGMSKTDLMNKAKLNSVTLAKIGKNKYISMNTLDKICNALDCDFGEIMEHVKEENREVLSND